MKAIAERLRARHALRRLQGDESGAAAVEFGFIASIMLTMIMGIVDISNAVSVNWRMTQLNRTLADLSAQMRQVTNADLNTIFAASAATLRPHDGPMPRMVITSVVVGPDRVAKVCWSVGSNAAPLPTGQVVTLPAGLNLANTALMMTTVDMIYDGFITPSFDMTASSLYYRPRQAVRGGPNNVEQVERIGSAMC